MKNKTFIAMLIGAVIALILTVAILVLTAKTVHIDASLDTTKNSFITQSAVATRSASAAPEVVGEPHMVKIFEVSSKLGVG